MIATDASGQGNCTYGRTRDHVLTLDCVLLGGERFESQPLSDDEPQATSERPGPVGAYRTALNIVDAQGALITQMFPRAQPAPHRLRPRPPARAQRPLRSQERDRGRRGVTRFVVEARLNVLPIPRHPVLVNVRYPAFMDALRDAQPLTTHRPLSIETVDSKVLLLAMQDIGSVTSTRGTQLSRQRAAVPCIP